MADDKKQKKPTRYWLGDSYQKYREYQRTFAREKYRLYTYRVRRSEDPDVVALLDSLAKRNDYLRALIKADLAGARLCDNFARAPGPVTDEAGRVWVVDRAAYSEVIQHDEVGHWEDPPLKKDDPVESSAE